MNDLIYKQAAIDAAVEAADEWDGGCNPEREKAIRTAIMALPAANLWIPCKKKLPDKYGFYLVTLNNATTDFCLWNAMEFGWEASGIFNKCDEVTAWMPLPEPYTKEDEDDTVN